MNTNSNEGNDSGNSNNSNNSNNGFGFMDITAVESDSNNLPDSSSSFENNSSSFFKDLTPKRRSSRRKTRTSSNLNPAFIEPIAEIPAESKQGSRKSSFASSKDSSVLEQSTPNINRTVDITADPATTPENVFINNELSQSALQGKRDYLKKINELLKQKLLLVENVQEDTETTSPNTVTSLSDLDRKLIKILLKNKAGANIIDTLNEDKDTESLVLYDDLERFSVLPLSNDWKLRHRLLRKFTPFMTIENVRPQMVDYENARVKQINFTTFFKSLFNLDFEFLINPTKTTLIHFDLKNLSSKNINGLPKVELCSLIDNYFKVTSNDTQQRDPETSAKNSQRDQTLHNTMSNVTSTFAATLSDSTLISQLSLSGNSYNLRLRDDKDITHWFYSLNNYTLVFIKRILMFLKVIHYFHNYETKDFLDTLLHPDLKTQITKNLQLIFKSLKCFEDHIESKNDAEIEGGEDVDHYDSDDPLNRLFLILKLLSNFNVDQYLAKFVDVQEDQSYLYEKNIIFSLLKYFKNFDTLKLGHKFHYNLIINWSINFNSIQNGSPKALATSNLTMNDEHLVKLCEPRSVFEAIYKPNIAQKAQNDDSNKHLVPLVYSDLNELLSKLMERKGVINGLCIFVEGFYGLEGKNL